MENPFVWFDLVTSETATARRFYVRVAAVGDATKRAAALGGTVIQEHVPGPSGDYSVIEDPTGAVLARWQPRA